MLEKKVKDLTEQIERLKADVNKNQKRLRDQSFNVLLAQNASNYTPRKSSTPLKGRNIPNQKHFNVANVANFATPQGKSDHKVVLNDISEDLLQYTH